MKRLLLGLFGVLLSGVALTAGLNAAKQVEASMLVTGSVVVAPDGDVQSYVIDHPEKLPSGVTAVVERTVPGWKFAPVLVNGKPVVAKAQMTLRIVARRLQKDDFSVSIRSASFGGDSPGEAMSYKATTEPVYPHVAVHEGVEGTVYMLLKVGRNGLVEEAVAEQVNLYVMSDDATMKRWRNVLAVAALSAGRDWKFNPPTTGSDVNDAYWVARVPVTFRIRREGDTSRHEGYGHWEGYVRGPIQPTSWLDQNQLASSGIDAIPDGGIQQLGKHALQLKTPLSGS